MRVSKRQLRRIIKEEKARLLKEQAGGTFDAALEELRDVVDEAKMYAGAAEGGRKKAIAYGASDAELAIENGRAGAYEDMYEMLLPVLEMFEKLRSETVGEPVSIGPPV